VLARGANIARAQFGAVHVTLSNMLLRLATLERDAGDAQRAIAVLDEAEAALPPGEVGARAQLLATRGGTWVELGDGLRAEADLREAVRLRRESGGLRNGLAWYNQAQLGEALLLQGRLDEANAVQAEAARELRALLGPDAYQNALVAQRWAKTLEARGDFEAAAAQWRESLRLIEATYGVDHFGHLDMGSRLAAALARTPAGLDEALALADILLTRWQVRPDTAGRIAALRILRCTQADEPADVEAARTLLAAGGSDLDAAQRSALTQCADRPAR
jgi:serine/threonine-protein kinase